jgi:hypothetical protein
MPMTDAMNKWDSYGSEALFVKLMPNKPAEASNTEWPVHIASALIFIRKRRRLPYLNWLSRFHCFIIGDRVEIEQSFMNVLCSIQHLMYIAFPQTNADWVGWWR